MPIFEPFFDAPEYEEWCTESQLKDKYSIHFKESGWYQLENGDTILAIARHSRIKVWLFIGPSDPREEIEKILDLPFFNEDNNGN